MKTYTQMKSIQNFNKKALRGALVAAGMTMASTSVFAATDSGDMTVNAALTSACSISTSTLSFGDIAALDSTEGVTFNTGATLQIACSNGTADPTIYSDATARNLIGSGTADGGTMAFNLSQTAGAPDDNLSSTSPGEAITGWTTANGAAQTVTIYGLIPSLSFAGQPVGPYSATINLSVEYL